MWVWQRRYWHWPLQLLIILSLHPIAVADVTAESYQPDVLELDGTNALRFRSSPLLNLDLGGVIEFWVAADWDTEPNDSPVILSNHRASDELPSWQIKVSADRQALQIQSTDQFGEFEFSFADGELHHVALLVFEDATYGFIDGQVAGAVAMKLGGQAADEFWIGAGPDNRDGFMGALAGLRIWEGVFEIETIAAYALRSVADPQAPHPHADALILSSDFRDQTVEIAKVVELAPLNEVLQSQAGEKR